MFLQQENKRKSCDTIPFNEKNLGAGLQVEGQNIQVHSLPAGEERHSGIRAYLLTESSRELYGWRFFSNWSRAYFMCIKSRSKLDAV